MTRSDELLAFVFFAGFYFGWFTGIIVYRLIRRALWRPQDEGHGGNDGGRA